MTLHFSVITNIVFLEICLLEQDNYGFKKHNKNSSDRFCFAFPKYVQLYYKDYVLTFQQSLTFLYKNNTGENTARFLCARSIWSTFTGKLSIYKEEKSSNK